MERRSRLPGRRARRAGRRRGSQRHEARRNPGPKPAPGRESPPHAGDGRRFRPGLRCVRAGHRPALPGRPARPRASRPRRRRTHRLPRARRSGARCRGPGRGDGRALPGPPAHDPDLPRDRPGEGAHVGGDGRLEGGDARRTARRRRDDPRRPRHRAGFDRVRRRGGGAGRGRLNSSAARERPDVEDRVQGIRRTVRAPRPARVLRARRAGGIRLDHGERSLPAVAAHRRPCPLLLRVARGAGRTHVEGDDRHQRGHPDVSLPPLDRRAGDGDARRDVSGPGDAGGRHRRIAERGAVHRLRVAAVSRAVPPAQGVDRADAQALVGGAGHLRRGVLPHRERDHLRSARHPHPALRRRLRGGRGAARGDGSRTGSSAPVARSPSCTRRRCCRRCAKA